MGWRRTTPQRANNKLVGIKDVNNINFDTLPLGDAVGEGPFELFGAETAASLICVTNFALC